MRTKQGINDLIKGIMLQGCINVTNLESVANRIIEALSEEDNLIIPDVSQQSELLLSAICQFTKRNTQKEIQEVEKWIETDFRK